jgi:hypothetical protein
MILGEDSFSMVVYYAEVKYLSRIHHKYLVNLVGFCKEKGTRIQTC